MLFKKRNNKVTLRMFKELSEIKQEDYDNEIDYFLNIMSVYLDKSLDEIKTYDVDKLMSLQPNISLLNLKNSNPIIKTKAGKFHTFPFEKLSIGEFIDLEHLISHDFNQNINKILVILYRKKISGGLLFPDKIEPYGDYLEHRAPLFDDIEVTSIFGVINEYNKFRTKILKTYEGLFGDPDEVSEVDEDYEETAKERREREQEAKLRSKWGWDSILFRLANNDPTKYEEATNLPLIQALNTISMIRELKIS